MVVGVMVLVLVVVELILLSSGVVVSVDVAVVST